MARPRNLTLCSFCGKSHAEVRKLVSGPGVYICDECIETFKQVLDKELAEEAPKGEAPQLAIKQRLALAVGPNMWSDFNAGIPHGGMGRLLCR